MSKNQVEYMAELRDTKGKQQELYENNDRFYNQVRQEQKEMVQEIQQIKNYQVNQTLVDSIRHKAYMDELAAMKRLHFIRGSYTYNMEAILNFSIFSNSNSNPISFGHQFHSLIKGIIGRIKRRPIED
ncbi:hypothetical protein PIB30_086133 [Stylosanthes scabra]|uniref:Uncharacterized protein n=1 Tax=Stylosanthes scabra TaxID=79078 RepID=A0ABU6XS19_9FABA|nr:hypothetical protein [Stylosanthes scabra]